MPHDNDKDITAIFREGTQIKRALQAATREAIKQHKQAGLLMPVWRDGQTVFIMPEELGATLPDDGSQDVLQQRYGGQR